MFPPDPGQHRARNARISASNILLCVNICEGIQKYFPHLFIPGCVQAVISYHQASGYSELIKSHDNLNDLVRKDHFFISQSEASLRNSRPMRGG